MIQTMNHASNIMMQTKKVIANHSRNVQKAMMQTPKSLALGRDLR